jgi:hypothetical protein
MKNSLGAGPNMGGAMACPRPVGLWSRARTSPLPYTGACSPSLPMLVGKFRYRGGVACSAVQAPRDKSLDDDRLGDYQVKCSKTFNGYDNSWVGSYETNLCAKNAAAYLPNCFLPGL